MTTYNLQPEDVHHYVAIFSKNELSAIIECPMSTPPSEMGFGLDVYAPDLMTAANIALQVNVRKP